MAAQGEKGAAKKSIVNLDRESSLPASTPLTKRLTVHILAYRGPHLRPVPSPLRSLRFMDKEIRVKFTGGREVVGTLKGCDQLLNLVLDNTIEYLRDPDDVYKVSDATRSLGLVVCRGTQVVVVMPTDGMDEIQNPFIQEE